MKSDRAQKSPARRGLVRGLGFRLAAVLIGLSPFLAAEAAFTLLDWGRPEIGGDPFVGFRAVRPLFVPSEDGRRRQIEASRLPYFRPDSFAVRKPAGGFRVFCLGGSTVQGRPFAVETSFATWLQLALEAGEADRRWEVVNCGGVSYASYRLVPILEEVLDYEPDLIVLYTGHNEFLEDRTYRHVKRLPTALAWPCRQAAKTRTFVVLDQVVRRGRAADRGDDERPLLEAEVDAMLEHHGGLEEYHRDEKWRRDTIAHYRYNLERMARLTREAGVPLLLVNPVCNLRDCPPFKSQHRDGLAPEELARWQALVDEAAAGAGGDARRALALLQEAEKIDDQHAGLHYLAAKCRDDLGMLGEARDAYLRAKEADVCPLRILEPMNEAVLEIAARHGTMLVDVRRFYEQESDAGIPGNFLLVDHVHPSIAGHQKIANLLAGELIEQGFFRPGSGWEEARDRRYGEHFDSLDALYFSKGQQRLEALRRWTQGRASRRHLPAETPDAPPAGQATQRPP